MNRQKDIQYASRASATSRGSSRFIACATWCATAARLPKDHGQRPEVAELASYGCGTTMHLVRLLAPRLDNEDHTKDIDFSAAGSAPDGRPATTTYGGSSTRSLGTARWMR